MKFTTKSLPKSQVELTITVPADEQQPHLLKAAKKISEDVKIPGFRPGFAPYNIVVSHVGEMKILDVAVDAIVRETFVKAVKEEKLMTVGMPNITIDKLAPNNDLVYRAIVSLVPTVTLPDLKKISVDLKTEPVTDEKIDSLIKELQGMHAETQEAGGAAGPEDQVTVDMDLLDGAVPLEGGQAKDHIVNLNEPTFYIPGFTDKLIGTKAGDELSFELPFPADHYQKAYAGKDITFKVKVKKVQHRVLPEVTDEWAKKLGVASVAELRENITKNVTEENRRKGEEVAEIEVLKKLVEKTTFGGLPESLVDAERRKLLQELMQNLQQHGITPEQYLAELKKTPEELEAGFADQAIERVKMGLITHEVAKQQNIDVTKKELEDELNAIQESYRNNSDAIKRLRTPEVQEAVMNSMRNRKVMEWLGDQIIKRPSEK